MKTKNVINDLFAMFAIILIVAAMIIALSLATMLLWNWTLPHIIVCDKISLLQAAGILALVSLLTFDKQKLFGWLYE